MANGWGRVGARLAGVLAFGLVLGAFDPGLGLSPAIGKTPPRRRAPAKRPTPPPPPAAEAPAPVPVEPTGRGPTRIDFDDRLVQGQRNQTGAVVLFARKAAGLSSMVERRKSFRERTLRTVFEP